MPGVRHCKLIITIDTKIKTLNHPTFIKLRTFFNFAGLATTLPSNIPTVIEEGGKGPQVVRIGFI